MQPSPETTRHTIMSQIEDLMLKIKNRLNKSKLLETGKTLTPVSQPKTITQGPQTKLADYQLYALAWMCELANNKFSGILADDMGLGKTIQAIAYLSLLQEQKGIKGKHLIVVPKNVLNNWNREFLKWNPSFNVVILPGTEQQRENILKNYVRPGKFDVLLATYQSVQSAESALKKYMYETLIVDEAHSIKNSQTCLSGCLRRFRAKFSLLLTGTPLSNQLKQLWSLLSFVAPEIFKDDSLFSNIQDSVNVQCKDDEEKIKYQTQIASRFKAIINPFMLRRVKDELNLGLKGKKQFCLFVSLTQLQLKMYRNYLKCKSVYGDDNACSNKQMQLRKICAHPYLFPGIEDPKQPPYGEHLIETCGKLKMLDKLLKKLLKQKHKILIFSQFVILIKILQDYCTYRNYKYKIITGQSSLQQRDQGVQSFSNDPDTNIFLISTRAGGIGLNLVAADVVIIYDIDWNPQMDKQAMDRAYRLGQKNSVMVFKFISNNTVEERLLQVQKYKLIWDELVIQKGGLARCKSAEEKFQKMDLNHIAGLGAEEIFKFQQNLDDKTIEEIIKMGEEKDMQKTKEIRQKLQKQFQVYGDLGNPFDQIQKAKATGKINSGDFKVQQIGVVEQKKRLKPVDGRRFKFIQPSPHHFFKNVQYAGELLYDLQNLDTDESQQKRQEIVDKLMGLGFYDWSITDFDNFVKANQTILKGNFKQIAKKIGSKTQQDVQKYSEVFYKSAQIKGLSKQYKKILNAQKQLQITTGIAKSEKQLKAYPSYLVNFKNKLPPNQVNNESAVIFCLNDFYKKGLLYSNCEQILQRITPSVCSKYNFMNATNNQKNAFLKKIVDGLYEESDAKEQLSRRYTLLTKKYFPEEKKSHNKISRKPEVTEDDSLETVVKC